MSLLEGIWDIEGWMGTRELNYLYEAAQSVPPGKIICEIGAWMGRSTAALFQGAAEKNPVITIDTWKGSPDEEPHKIAQQIDIHSIFMRNMESCGFDVTPLSLCEIQNDLAPGCYYIVGDSLQIVDYFPCESIAFLFYDGRHTTTGANIDAWLPKVEKGGLFTGHDYFCFYEHIQQEIHKRFWIDEIHGTIWVKRII